MVEFKYDAQHDTYTLMEINGRFPASTALSLDAGLNLPHLAYCLHAGLPLPAQQNPPRVGVEERWLQGDAQALGSTCAARLGTKRCRAPVSNCLREPALYDFWPPAGAAPGRTTGSLEFIQELFLRECRLCRWLLTGGAIDHYLPQHQTWLGAWPPCPGLNCT
jgi:hypothetical protein